MTPAKLETIAFLMWRYCEPRGWDCTARDVGGAIGVSYQTIGHVAKVKGWTTRLRTWRHDVFRPDSSDHNTSTAAALAGIKETAGLDE
jgi:hypothetical protein